MSLRLDTTARRIDVPGRKLLVTGPDGGEELLTYDELVIGTGAVPSVRRSPGWTSSARPTGSTCCTRWTTPSRSCAP